MTTIKISTLCAAMMFTLNATFVRKSASSYNNVAHDSTQRAFVVLELFTSEGCSSCPPAEDVLTRIQKDADQKKVYILSYHVDYWDHLGWKDAFSSVANSKRQYAYSDKFSGQVYTPQLIVNGNMQFVGSNARAINGAIHESLQQARSTTLSLRTQSSSDTLNLYYEVDGVTTNDQLVIAFIQKHAERKIMRGENEGRTLEHVQIVQHLDVFNISRTKKGIEKITLPHGFNTQDWEVIGMLQNPQTHSIIAAARTVFYN